MNKMSVLNRLLENTDINIIYATNVKLGINLS